MSCKQKILSHKNRFCIEVFKTKGSKIHLRSSVQDLVVLCCVVDLNKLNIPLLNPLFSSKNVDIGSKTCEKCQRLSLKPVFGLSALGLNRNMVVQHVDSKKEDLLPPQMPKAHKVKPQGFIFSFDSA